VAVGAVTDLEHRRDLRLPTEIRRGIDGVTESEVPHDRLALVAHLGRRRQHDSRQPGGRQDIHATGEAVDRRGVGRRVELGAPEMPTGDGVLHCESEEGVAPLDLGNRRRRHPEVAPLPARGRQDGVARPGSELRPNVDDPCLVEPGELGAERDILVGPTDEGADDEGVGSAVVGEGLARRRPGDRMG
jgi:hypothetical protein